MTTCMGCYYPSDRCICYEVCYECGLEFSSQRERCPNMEKCDWCGEWTHGNVSTDDGYCKVCGHTKGAHSDGLEG